MKAPWIPGLALTAPFPGSTLLQPRAQLSVIIQCRECLPCSAGMLPHPELWAYSRQTHLEKLGGWSHLCGERGKACCQLHCRIARALPQLPEDLEASRATSSGVRLDLDGKGCCLSLLVRSFRLY